MLASVKLRRIILFALYAPPMLVLGITMMTLDQVGDAFAWFSALLKRWSLSVETYAVGVADRGDKRMDGTPIGAHNIHPIPIIINARAVPWPPGEISFEQIIAFSKQPAQATVTVCYPSTIADFRDRSLIPGQSAPVRHGMMISAIVTGSA